MGKDFSIYSTCNKENLNKQEYEEKKLTKELILYKNFWLFVVFSIIGVVIESIWCFLNHGYFESRQGLIYGPISQIYGFGSLILIYLLSKIKSKGFIKLFIASAIIGGVFEYLCSFFQELMLGSVSWQYTTAMALFNGRTCFTYSIFWGLLGMVLIKYIYPFLSKVVEVILYKISKVITWVCIVFIVFDFVISAAAVYRQSQRYDNIPATNEIQKFLDEKYPDSFMKEIYPNMKFKN